MWFEAILGLRINLNKSEIILVGRIENVQALALELGCKLGTLHSSNLGLPLETSHDSVGDWDIIEERNWKRLAF